MIKDINKTINVSIVIPAKNEAANIKPLVDEIMAQFANREDFEIIYIDDGSTDGTDTVIRTVSHFYPNRVRLIQHQESVGQSTAICTGVKRAFGDLIVTIDADGQNDPADIPKLLKRATTFVVGRHFCITGYRKRRKDTAWKRFQSRIANKIRASLLHDNTPDTGCSLKVFPRQTFLNLPYFDHMHRFLPALIQRSGGLIEVVEVNHRDRQHGESKYGMWGRLFAGLIDMCGVMWLQRRHKLPVINEPVSVSDNPNE